jgi:hypothetical protein
VVIAEGEYLILMDRAQLLDDGRRHIFAVRFVKAEELRRSGEREEQYAWSNEESDVGMPSPDAGRCQIGSPFYLIYG